MALSEAVPAARATARRVLGAAAVVVVALAAAGPGKARAQTFELLDYSGAELFERFCAACHGVTARGDGPVGRRLNVAVPDLTRISERHGGEFPAAEVAQDIDGRSLVVAHGTRTMPVWGYELWVDEGADVTAERSAREIIDRLVAYLRSVQAAPPAPDVPR